MEKKTITYSDGSKYVGEVLFGVPNGNGAYTTASKDTYEGEWMDGLPYGLGKYTSFDKQDIYEGSFYKGIRHGYGVLKSGDITISGTWVYGSIDFNDLSDKIKNNPYLNLKFSLNKTPEKLQQVKEKLLRDADYTYATNKDPRSTAPSKFNGGISYESIADGTILYIWDSGDAYLGQSVNGVREGQGRYVFSSGNVYIGEWLKGKRSGEGTLYYNNGSVCEGNFKDSMFHGRFKRTFKDGTFDLVTYQNGTLEGKYEYYDFANNYHSVGQCVNGEFHGKFKVTSNGEVYYKEYVNGVAKVEPKKPAPANNTKPKNTPSSTSSSRSYVDEITFDKVYNKDDYLLYAGYYKNGRKHGSGEEYVYGNYEDSDVYDKKIIVTQIDEHYEGEFKDGERHGYGKLTKYNRTYFGSVINKSSMIYEGEFKNGRFHSGSKQTLEEYYHELFR